MRVAEAGPLKFVADAAGIGEQRLLHPDREVLAERHLGFAGKVIARPLQHEPADGHQLVQVVVGEIKMVSDA